MPWVYCQWPFGSRRWRLAVPVLPALFFLELLTKRVLQDTHTRAALIRGRGLRREALTHARLANRSSQWRHVQAIRQRSWCRKGARICFSTPAPWCEIRQLLGRPERRGVFATHRGSECVSRPRRRIQCHRTTDRCNEGKVHRVQETDRRRAAPALHAAAEGVSTTPLGGAPRSRQTRRLARRRRASAQRDGLARPLVLAGRSRRRAALDAIAAKLIL
jgi:hypothetical protein